MIDEYKKEFLEIEHPHELEDFKRKYPNYKTDIDMRRHFSNILKEHNLLETSENHSDPRKIKK
ncbi:MAG: hypothetical protein ACOX2Q_10735 [Dehalobacterium sp.]|jgi:hypothetical protein